MAITVTPKYKPFTYEELVKPLEGYWKDYDKAEEDLAKLETDTAVLQSVIDSMPEGEEKAKYTNYLSALNSQAEALASQGLTRDNRNALRNIKTQYSALIPRLSLAEEARRKDLASYTQRANSGEYFMDSGNSPLNKSVIDYLDGNIPLYNNGINKKTLGADVEGVAKAYSSRIFPETNIEEVEKIKNKFIKVTQEQGVNADFSQVEGNEQFMPILNALYEQYGIDKMTGAEQASAKDFVNMKFWEGLVYKKAEDYQQLKAKDDLDKQIVKVGTLPDGTTVVRSGNRHFITDSNNQILGTFNDNPPKPPAPAQEKEERKRFNYLRTVEHANDVYLGKNIGVTHGNNANTDVGNDISSLVSKYVKTVTTGEEKPRNSTRLMRNAITNGSIYEQRWYDEARKNSSNQDDFDNYRTLKNSIFLGTGSNVGGKRSEWFGDNHISMLDLSSFLNVLSDQMIKLTSEQREKILNDLSEAYGESNSLINAFIEEQGPISELSTTSGNKQDSVKVSKKPKALEAK